MMRWRIGYWNKYMYMCTCIWLLIKTPSILSYVHIFYVCKRHTELFPNHHESVGREANGNPLGTIATICHPSCRNGEVDGFCILVNNPRGRVVTHPTCITASLEPAHTTLNRWLILLWWGEGEKEKWETREGGMRDEFSTQASMHTITCTHASLWLTKKV